MYNPNAEKRSSLDLATASLLWEELLKSQVPITAEQVKGKRVYLHCL